MRAAFHKTALLLSSLHPVFRIAALATLFFDAYLVLGSIAIRRMPLEHIWMLPVLNLEPVYTLPGPIFLAILLWTTLLAVGCLIGPAGRKAEARG